MTGVPSSEVITLGRVEDSMQGGCVESLAQAAVPAHSSADLRVKPSLHSAYSLLLLSSGPPVTAQFLRRNLPILQPCYSNPLVSLCFFIRKKITRFL